MQEGGRNQGGGNPKTFPGTHFKAVYRKVCTEREGGRRDYG